MNEIELLREIFRLEKENNELRMENDRLRAEKQTYVPLPVYPTYPVYPEPYYPWSPWTVTCDNTWGYQKYVDVDFTKEAYCLIS